MAFLLFNSQILKGFFIQKNDGMTENICDINNKQFLAKVYWMDDHKPWLGMLYGL